MRTREAVGSRRKRRLLVSASFPCPSGCPCQNLFGREFDFTFPMASRARVFSMSRALHRREIFSSVSIADFDLLISLNKLLLLLLSGMININYPVNCVFCCSGRHFPGRQLRVRASWAGYYIILYYIILYYIILYHHIICMYHYFMRTCWRAAAPTRRGASFPPRIILYYIILYYIILYYIILLIACFTI